MNVNDNVNVNTNVNNIIKKLKCISNPDAVERMVKFGITPDNTFGVSIPNLRSIKKETGKDHALAQYLWKSGIRETMILASMIDEPEMVTQEQMEQWVLDLNYWEICDQCCMNLFEKTGFAYQKAIEWSFRDEEFVKRAGFVLMARLAVSDKNADDSRFEQFFPIIVRESCDERNYVKKAVNWALRQIGKRNFGLNIKAIETAKEIQEIDSKSAKWIASDAIRELTGKAVQKRVFDRMYPAKKNKKCILPPTVQVDREGNK
ncbi:MAG: DNA alkylation repair protein [Methanosarcinaceae archaeon]